MCCTIVVVQPKGWNNQPHFVSENCSKKYAIENVQKNMQNNGITVVLEGQNGLI